MGIGKNALAAFALLLLLPLAYSATSCVSYDQEVIAGGVCCAGLLPATFTLADGSTVQKCTQQNNVCTIMPEAYTPGPAIVAAAGGEGSPTGVTGQLETGGGIGESGTGLSSSSALYRVGWFSDWRIAGIIGVAIATIIIALAAMVGHGFNLPEVKAFVDAELMQAVISALLIGGLIALVAFFDTAALQAIAAADLPVAPVAGEPAYITAAKFYIGSLYDTADLMAKNSLTESVKKQSAASYGITTQANFWLLLFAGSTVRPNAGMSIDAERSAAVFEGASRMMASLYAQKYFIDAVSYGIAPIFLLLGIILRTFFFTRKLGGLLLAIAIALFIVYPLSYAFAWYTLNVTVYGERTFAATDPSCPAECTARYPVAFFVNASTGRIVQFETTQDLIQSGLNGDNWQTGDLDGVGDAEFPGLVACRNLTGIGITELVAPNACGGCPDYCREVPFPSGLPGCDIAACSECSAGCKIMRQRDCRFDCTASQCPLECRTKNPTENKCFFSDENIGGANIMQADLGATCEGCGSCPNWCRFLYKDSEGNYKSMYENDAACRKPECYPPSLTVPGTGDTGTCSLGCFYVTEIGQTTECAPLCTDAASGTVCPDFCRVRNLTDSTFVSTYDLPPQVYDQCYNPATADPRVVRACTACPSSCKISVSESQAYLQSCAAFPTAAGPAAGTACENCPEYCRFPDYSFITPYSQTPMSGGVPAECEPGLSGRLDCSGGACDGSCLSSGPITCREYSDAAGEPDDYCRKCPQAARVTLDSSANGWPASYRGPPLLADGNRCDDAECASECRPTRALPTRDSDGNDCKVDDGDPTSTCPSACRVLGIDEYLHPDCLSNPACDSNSVPDSCKVSLGATEGLVCSEYMGNGVAAESCQGPSAPAPACSTFGDETSCSGQSSRGCFWGKEQRCFGLGNCPLHPDFQSCNTDPDNECIWAEADSTSVPIDLRDPAYGDRNACKQCPENCRINGYEGNCGAGGAPGERVDCSIDACPQTCRVDIAGYPTGGTPMCAAFSSFDKPCDSCPALCRRLNDAPPSGTCPATACGPYDASAGIGCTDYCRFPDAPDRVCGGCSECPLDCTYYPAARTDCSEVCTDEALAGPVNIAPDDFIKGLPGATGASDVKGLGVLMVPALVLPLFCIVIVIAFIRVLSPLLGGDIEIPGLGKII